MVSVGSESFKFLIQNYIHQNKIMVFSKSFCPFCIKVKELFSKLKIPYVSAELDQIDGGISIQNELYEITGSKTVPQVFINGKNVGGYEKTVKLYTEGGLLNMINPPIQKYDYNLVVIGGGSGGLSASKEAAKYGWKVAVCDFVKPTPKGYRWGLGGTCVNVGCIPKKLMHHSSIIGDLTRLDSPYFGWKLSEQTDDKSSHDWKVLVQNVQNYISSLNWNYRVQLRSSKVDYYNAFASFVDNHKIKLVDISGKEKFITSDYFILAMGGRPNYLDIPGAKEYAITSDDIFSLEYFPKKTLLIGASYISLECAGFLHGIGCDTSVMVRSILLRGFDQQMANMIGKHMESLGIKFIKECVPIKIEEIMSGSPGIYKVTAQKINGDIIEEQYNTILFAIGRSACTKQLGLEEVGVKLNPKNGKVICDENERSSVSNIYAIGDILDGKQELTPVAVEAGLLLARRLCQIDTVRTDYINVPTTVFTPLEYSCVGYSEENALAKWNSDDINVYHTYFDPLEFKLSQRNLGICYVKIICVKSLNEKIVGMHYFGPNAGEVMQGYSIGLKLGATKSDLDALIGIHPTTAEIFTMLSVNKSSGQDISPTGC